MRENLAAEVGQQAIDLAPLLGGEERQVVVGLDDLHRLDEDGLAGPERSCTIPGTRARLEAWTGRQ